MTIRDEMIATGAIRPRPRVRFHEVTDRDPTPPHPIDGPRFALDDIGRAAAAKHVARYRSGHGDAEYRAAFDDRPTGER